MYGLPSEGLVFLPRLQGFGRAIDAVPEVRHPAPPRHCLSAQTVTHAPEWQVLCVGEHDTNDDHRHCCAGRVIAGATPTQLAPCIQSG